MIRKVVAAAVALGFLGAASGARALPDEPFGSLPLIYDANDKLIGTYDEGRTYITIDGQFYRLYVGIDRLPNTGSARIFYAGENCVGKIYGETLNKFQEVTRFAPTIAVTTFEGIFFATGSAREVETKSVRGINSGNPPCSNITYTGKRRQLTNKPLSYLGITFPLRLEVPGSTRR